MRGVLEIADVAEADEERDHADYAEAAVDEAPVGRDSADGTGDQGERNDSDAGDDAELQDPFVADWIDEPAKEGDGDDQVSEGWPVGAVRHEWVGLVRMDDTLMDAAEPGVEGGFAVEWGCGCDVEDLVEECGFAFEGEGCDAADHQPNDEEY